MYMTIYAHIYAGWGAGGREREKRCVTVCFCVWGRGDMEISSCCVVPRMPYNF